MLQRLQIVTMYILKVTNFIFNYFFLQNSSLTCDQCNILGSLWNLADPGNKICQLVILNNGMIYLT